jgi:hypothetical protein
MKMAWRPFALNMVFHLQAIDVFATRLPIHAQSGACACI